MPYHRGKKPKNGRGKKPKKLSQGGSLTHMGNAFPDATTNRISRGIGDAVSGVKFRGVR